MSIKKKVSGELAEKYMRSEKILLHCLARREREIIRKENPLRKRRNKLIRGLYCEGVSGVLLAKISGLAESHIRRILKGVRRSVR